MVRDGASGLWRKRLTLIGLILVGNAVAALLLFTSVAGLWRAAGLNEAQWDVSLHEYRDWRVGCRYYVEVTAEEPPDWLRFSQYLHIYEGDSRLGMGLYSSGPESSQFSLLAHVRAYQALGYCHR